MDDQRQSALLRLQSTVLTHNTQFCAEDQEIAEYFDSDLAEVQRNRLERHLVVCRYCRARLGVLERLQENAPDHRIPGAVLATAKQMTSTTPKRKQLVAPAWAAAAILIITLTAYFSLGQQVSEHPGAPSSIAPTVEEPSRQMRRVIRNMTELTVFNPARGADIDARSLLKWAEVPGNIHYEIFVLSHTGDVLWTERLQVTEWSLRESLQLASGERYYFRVEAQLPDGNSVSSQHVNFRITAQQ